MSLQHSEEKKGEPDGAANGNQPKRLDNVPTSEAAGSRR